REVPIYLSAVFPKGVALCGEIADGIILTRSTLRTAASVRVQLAEAAHRVGRDPAKIEVASLLPTSVSDTREAALATLRPGLAFYAGFFPRYNRMMAEHGYPVQAAAIAEAWARGDREAGQLLASAQRIRSRSRDPQRPTCRYWIPRFTLTSAITLAARGSIFSMDGLRSPATKWWPRWTSRCRRRDKTFIPSWFSISV